MQTYVLSSARRSGDRVVLQVVLQPSLQRMSILMPYDHTTDEEVQATIDQAVRGLNRRSKPLGVDGY